MTVTQIICLIVVLLLTVLGGFFIVKKSEKHDLLKWILLFIFVAMSLTWIFTYGYFNGTEFSDFGMNRLGFADIPNILYYAAYFAGDKILFLLALGCFYAVCAKVEGYKKLVARIAESFKGKEIIFILIVSLLFTMMASVFSQTFAVLTFVPFIVSILLSMKLDKLTAFSTTFGSILIGTLGYTYGGEGLSWFNQYTSLTMSTGILYRLVVLVVAFILFNLFNVMHTKKTLNSKAVNEKETDPFKVEKFDKKAKTWPIIVVLGILFVITILGYISWNTNFEIEIFNNFHTWLTEFQIGELAIFSSLLGTTAAAFGAWDLFNIAIILLIASVIVALLGRVKIDEFVDAYGEGVRKIGKSVFLFILVYALMIIVYMAPVLPTITNLILGGVAKFNPFLTTLVAFLANIFHTDFGFTGYLIGSFAVAKYAESATLIHLIFTTMYGFVQLCVPTSAVLLIGLSYLDIDYKTWIKYIWMFIVGILVILLVLFAILAYI